MTSGQHAFVDPGASSIGRWLRERRVRLALWIAIVEGIVVAVSPHVTRWTVIGISLAALAVYVVLLRNVRSDALRQIGWIAAASQLLALLVVVFAFILTWLAILAIVAFAVLALIYLVSDRR